MALRTACQFVVCRSSPIVLNRWKSVACQRAVKTLVSVTRNQGLRRCVWRVSLNPAAICSFWVVSTWLPVVRFAPAWMFVAIYDDPARFEGFNGHLHSFFAFFIKSNRYIHFHSKKFVCFYNFFLYTAQRRLHLCICIKLFLISVDAIETKNLE